MSNNNYSVTVPTSQLCNQVLCLYRHQLGYCKITGCVNNSKFTYASLSNRSITTRTVKCPCCGKEFEIE